MKRTMKRGLTWLLALAMLITVLPFTAFATISDTKVDMPIVPMGYANEINPLYADIITEPTLEKPASETEPQLSSTSEAEYATNYAEAAVQLREGMEQRLETIEVYYMTQNYDFYTDYPAIFAQALAHTGSPTEGDYLKWVWAEYRVGASGYVDNTTGTYYLVYTYDLLYHTTADQESELDQAVEALLTELNPTGSDYQKLKTVYDYMCANITYDYDSEGTLKHTAYAALVNKTAVCQGYAALLYRLALEMGIDNRVVSGIGNGGDHGWNIVELNDLYYNVDATWDATYLQGVGYYQYFLQCEDTFTEQGIDHIRDAEYDTEQFHADYPMGQTDFDPSTDDTAPGYGVTYTSASISLAGDIGVNYYAQLSEDLAAAEGAYMEFTVAGKTQTVPVSEAEVDADGIYRFTCKVATKQMTDTIVGQMYLADGTAVGEAKSYSVKAYCDAAIPAYSQYEDYAELVALMEAMLNYGGYSQVQFAYNTDDLANADLADTSLPTIAEADVAAYAHGATGSEEGISVASVSLLLESNTTIRFYFQLEGTKAIDQYTFYVDGVEVTPVESNGQYYVDKVNVAAKDLDEMATVTVGDLTVNYCGLSYVRQVAVLYPSYYSESLVNVAKALYAYNQAANAYFA